MALREVLKYPDRRLKHVSEPIGEVTDEIRALASELCDVMYAEPGVGLAAPQLGESVRLIVMDTEWTEPDAEKNPLVVANPEIVESHGKITWTEGCLSVPGFEAEVVRAERVIVHARDLDGKELEIEAEELRAVCLQHEIDHLDGILFIDRISRLKRSLYERKRRKALRRGEQPEESDSKVVPRL